jgi:hypothetical protein
MDTEMIVERYIASWNERNPDARRTLVATAFAEDADYLDPLMSGRGIDGIDAMIAAAQEQFPGHSFTLATGPDRHNNRVRFSWLLAPADAAPEGAFGASRSQPARIVSARTSTWAACSVGAQRRRRRTQSSRAVTCRRLSRYGPPGCR